MSNQLFVFRGIKFKKLDICLVAALFIFSGLLISFFFPPNKFEAKRIAHGGGEYKGNILTNSLEAMTYNYEKGYRYFEIDLNYTRDAQLVCVHRWSGNKTLSQWKAAPTGQDFFAFYADKDFKPCSVDGLMDWLNEHKDAVLITDIKQNEIIALEEIAVNFSHLTDRIIPQIYRPEDFNGVRSLGYGRIIWTLYRFKGNNKEVVFEVKKFERPFALVFDIERLNSGLMKEFSRQGMDVDFYMHTINSRAGMCELKKTFNVLEVFTDKLDPTVQC